MSSNDCASPALGVGLAIDLPLPHIPLGHKVIIRSIGGEVRLRRRLLELGLVPGTEIELVRRAPMGDPLEISVRGYRLSLRVAEAQMVAVSSAA